jgi:predicted Zn-dependent protease with MMP-like domain
MNFPTLERMARDETEKTIASLPPDVARPVQSVPVFFEEVPSADDIASGLDPDLLGLFDPGPGDLPAPRIRLWLSNLWEFSGNDKVGFREEVRITLLHEIGHLLGWDEEDLEERGLG